MLVNFDKLQGLYSAASRVLLLQRRCVSQTKQVYSLGCSPSSRLRTLTCSLTAIRSRVCRFMVSAPTID